MSANPQILVRGHLGAGDHLVCNAIYRHLAKTTQVFVVCKPHNQQTLSFMLRDVKNVEFLSLSDDDEADDFTRHVESRGHRVLRLGAYGEKPFNGGSWDIDMYRQAGIEFQMRWNEFVCHRQPSRELTVPKGPFAFVHEDPVRGFLIDKKRLPVGIPIVQATPEKSPVLFDWWGHVEMAEELHVIDSCMAILADSVPDVRAKVMQIHLYARPGALPPRYAKSWEILRA